ADLGGEEEPAAACVAHLGPEERADAEAVAGECEAAGLLLPDGESKLTADVVEGREPVLFPEGRHEFDVALRREAMAASLALPAGLGVVVEFAIGDDADRAVLVRERLPAVGDTDDAEATAGEADAVMLERAVLVRAAVHEGRGHCRQHARRQRAAPVEVE